jgi:hypothetical protein
MSSLLRPVGHLPASVYWFRRGLILAVAVVLLVVLLNVIGGGDPKNTAASGPQPSGDPTVAPTSTPTTTPTGKPDSKDTKKSSEPVKSSETPKDLKCAGTDVNIELQLSTRTMATGTAMNLVVQLGAAREECKATVDPSKLSLTITSGTDQIWTTQQCEKAIPKSVLVLAKGKQFPTTVPWDGRRSRPGCLPGQLQAKPGTYVAKAIYDGRASAPQAFQIT